MQQIGLIGVGHWGPNIARSIDHSGRAQVGWICDTSTDRLAKLGAVYPDAKTTTEMADVLGDDSVAAVAISTPVHTHYQLVKAALEAGKHVLVEKPMTATSAESIELIDLAAARGRVLMVGHVFEYNASIRALKELVDGGELGRVLYLSFVRTNLGPVRTDVNAFWDLASHDISVMTYLFGVAPVDVTARGRGYLNSSIEDAVFATFGFESGTMAHVNVSWLNPRKVRRITVVGDKKMAVWDDLELARPIQIYDQHVESPNEVDSYLDYKTKVVDGGVFIPAIQLNQPLQAEVNHFIECFIEGKTPQTDGANGLNVVRALEAATESMANGSVVTRII